jgi:hypothetical protein
MEKITVGIKRVNADLDVINVDNTLKTFQDLVGGYIEVVHLTEDGNILCICDEEGKLKEKPYNLKFGGDILVGDLVFVKNGDDGDFHSLEFDDLKRISNIIKKGGI